MYNVYRYSKCVNTVYICMYDVPTLYVQEIVYNYLCIKLIAANAHIIIMPGTVLIAWSTFFLPLNCICKDYYYTI